MNSMARLLRVGESLCAAGFLIALVAAQQPPWKAPARASRKPNPVRVDDRSIALGKELYAKECYSCHGRTGQGDGPTARDLETHPGDLSAPVLWEQTDGALFWKLTEGRTPMPAYDKTFTEEERWHVINYTRTLAPRPDVQSP